MRLQDGMRAREPQRSAWRFFPAAIIGGMLVVVGVNGGMIYAALHTFPGKAGTDGFDLSNHYNTVIAARERQNALGWTLQVDADASRHPVLVLADRTGAPLADATLTAVAERPVGAAQTTRMAFQQVAPGSYVGDAPLVAPGQWDLSLTATAGGHEVVVTRRILVR